MLSNEELKKYRSRKAQLKHRYKLPIEEYLNLYEEQDGQCAVCKTEIEKMTAHVDHCHDSGKIRGLLCGSCNIGLGYFKHDLLKLFRAAEYMRKHRK